MLESRSVIRYNDASRHAAASPKNRVSKSPHRTFKDVQAAFESRRVLTRSAQELEELLVAAAADDADRCLPGRRARER